MDKEIHVPYSTQQIYVQTADQSIVCTMGNASFDVDFNFINGVQVQSDYNITEYQPFWAPLSGGDIVSYVGTDNKTGYTPKDFLEMNSYLASFMAFASLLNGNVTTTLTNTNNASKNGYISLYDGNAIIVPSTSESLRSGLSACPEYAHGSVSQTTCYLILAFHVQPLRCRCQSLT
jgi:hypothetical protein